MQFTERQIRKLLALRRTYITQLVLMSRHRQQLLRQLQNQSPSQDIDREYLSSRHVTIDAMPKQLEECEKMEYVLYMQYVVAVAHGVSCYALNLLVQAHSTQMPLLPTCLCTTTLLSVQ